MGAHNHSDALLQGCGVLPQGGRHDGQLQVGLHDGRGALPAVERDAPPPLAVVAQFGPTLDHTIAAVGFVRGIKHIGAHRKAALPSTAWLSGAAGAGRIAIGTALTRRHRPSKCSCTGRRSEDQHSIMSTSSSMDRDFECCSGKAAGLRRTPVADSTYSNGGERWRCAAGAHCLPAVVDCTALLHCIQPST